MAGLDISSYAIDNAKEEVKPFLRVGNAVELPYGDKSMDLVVSINTLHNLRIYDLVKALRALGVSRRALFNLGQLCGEFCDALRGRDTLCVGTLFLAYKIHVFDREVGLTRANKLAPHLVSALKFLHLPLEKLEVRGELAPERVHLADILFGL